MRVGSLATGKAFCGVPALVLLALPFAEGFALLPGEFACAKASACLRRSSLRARFAALRAAFCAEVSLSSVFTVAGFLFAAFLLVADSGLTVKSTSLSR